MFEDMGFIKRYKINKAHLCRLEALLIGVSVKQIYSRKYKV